MRELIVEEANYIFKRRKPKQKGKEYEVKEYLGGLSFLVKESHIEKWRSLLLVRYFGHFGECTEADIKLHRKVDPNGFVLEEKFSINSVGMHANKPIKQLTITVYRTTSKILVQGQRKNDWIEKELDPFQEVVVNSRTSEEAIQLFENKMGFTVSNMDGILKEACQCACQRGIKRCSWKYGTGTTR